MGWRHGGRPNREMFKTTLYLEPKDIEAIREIQRVSGQRTRAGAIRYALQAVRREPPDTTVIAGRILQWADSLAFVSPSEQHKLWALSFELYNLINERE